jgi:hypothetical protein
MRSTSYFEFSGLPSEPGPLWSAEGEQSELAPFPTAVHDELASDALTCSAPNRKAVKIANRAYLRNGEIVHVIEIRPRWSLTTRTHITGNARVEVSRPGLPILFKESSRICKLQSIPQPKRSVVALAQMAPGEGRLYQRYWGALDRFASDLQHGCTGGELEQIQFLFGGVLFRCNQRLQNWGSNCFRWEQVVSLTPRAHRAPRVPRGLFLGTYRTACAIRLRRVRPMIIDIGSIASLTKANHVGDGDSPQKMWVFNKQAASHLLLMLSALFAQANANRKQKNASRHAASFQSQNRPLFLSKNIPGLQDEFDIALFIHARSLI